MSTPLQVVTIGSKPPAFSTYLERAGYIHAQQAVSYSDYTAKAETAPAALVLFGHDESLAAPEAIRKLLDSDVVLLSFSPSPVFLEALKAAINTIIDLPQIKLGDNVPIIVHKIKGVDRFHIVPGFFLKDLDEASVLSDDSVGKKLPSSRGGDSNIDPSRYLEYSVGLIGKAIERASDPDFRKELMNDGDNRNSVDTLTPPSGTSFVNQDSFTMTGRYTIIKAPWLTGATSWSELPSDQYQTFELSWTIFLYTYATNHSPIPNSSFTANGGVVYTVIRHSGNIQRSGHGRWFGPSGGDGSSESQFYFNDMFIAQVGDSSGMLKNHAQSPQNGTQSGTTFSYNIEYNKQLNLFKDNGKTAFQYQITYGESYTRDQIMQTPAAPDTSTYQLVHTYNHYYDRLNGGLSNETWWNHGVFDWSDSKYKTVQVLPRDDIPIRGFTMWSSGVGKTNLDFVTALESLGFKSNTAWGYGHFTYASVSGEKGGYVPLDLTFGGAA